MKIKKYLITWINTLSHIFISVIVLGMMLSIYSCTATEIPTEVTKEVATKETSVDSLSEWQVFIMALIEVECERNPHAVSDKGAVGPLQITQIYINEINRLYGTSYVLEDATDLNKALTMFEMMNDQYNPIRDVDVAIKLHNPKAGNWYAQRIKARIKLIKFNEEVRYQITELYNYI